MKRALRKADEEENWREKANNRTKGNGLPFFIINVNYMYYLFTAFMIFDM